MKSGSSMSKIQAMLWCIGAVSCQGLENTINE
jgi:hypothetical protein